MSKVLAVAWREFKATALTRAFIIAAFVVPVLAIGMGVLGPALFSEKPAPLSGTLVVIDPVGAVAEAAKTQFESDAPPPAPEASDPTNAGVEPPLPGPGEPPPVGDVRIGIRHITEPADDAALDALKDRVREGALVAVAQVTLAEEAPSETEPADAAPPADVGTFTVRLYLPADMNFKHTLMLEERLDAALSAAHLRRAGLDVQWVRELDRRGEVQTISLGEEAGEDVPSSKLTTVLKLMVPMAFMLLLWISTFVSANYLLTSTIEEKSNKVVEVLLSAVSPMQLMTGKIVGQALVGSVLLIMYAGLAATILAAVAVAGGIIGPVKLLLLGLYFVMAYFMIAAIMAGIGSAVNEMREAQSLLGPAMMVLMIPLFLWLPISDSPNGALATITGFIPPLTPFVMILRVNGSEPVAAWQVIATLVIGYAAAVAMIWMAAKIFRVGVLMYGKPPTPIELIRWIRYS
ncbi:MAG: ABC transporter permease [Planctomycetota bacterium]|nr:ABC transporter permease [Planctomycetota bacterium]